MLREEFEDKWRWEGVGKGLVNKRRFMSENHNYKIENAALLLGPEWKSHNMAQRNWMEPVQTEMDQTGFI